MEAITNSMTFLEMLIGSQVVKIFPTCIEPKNSSPCSP